MAQLLVRKLDDALVRKLKLRAGENGVSVEEEHRQILREVLLDGNGSSTPSFIEHLLNIPSVDDGEDSLFERDREMPERATPVEFTDL